MLYKAPGYLSTEVRCENPESRQYRVRDFWSWHGNFEIFRDRFRFEYEQFESWIVASGLVEKEQFLGAYYEKNPGDEDELVAD